MNMWKVIKGVLWLVAVLVLTVACSDDHDVAAPDLSGYEKVKIAVILPFGEGDTDWNNVLNWVKENIRKANKKVIPEYELYDENTVDIDAVATDLANRSDIAAIIGCDYSENTEKLAAKCVKTKKPVFTFSTSEQLQRKYGKSDFLWCLAENDIAQSELLLVQAANFGVKRVSLLASDDLYGQTFVDWFAFQASEMDMEPVDIEEFESDNIEEKCKAITQDSIDCIICVPTSVEDISKIEEALYYKYGYEGIILYSDGAYDSQLISTLGTQKAEGITGISMAADPKTGFSIAYEVEYGSYPDRGVPHVYDAVMTTCYAYRYAQLHNMTVNEAVSALLNQKAEEYGMWSAGAMGEVFLEIEGGGTPGFSGASSSLDFSVDRYSIIQRSTYMLWQVYEGKFIQLDYDARDGNSSMYSSWEWNKQVMQMFDESYVSPTTYPKKEGNWAVVVAGSRQWTNYRHQADALAFYQLLKKNGYDDDHIVLIMEDDLAYNEKNPEPGVVRHTAGGENLYHDVEVDYKLSDVSPEMLEEILLGKTDKGLKAGAKDNVILFWSGHGNKGEWAWGDDDAIKTAQLKSIVEQMSAQKKFRKMLGLIETCYAGSMAEAIKGIPGVLFMTASNAYETSKADEYSTELTTWMTNRFTTTLLSSLNNNADITLRELYYNLFSSTLGSHVTVYNAGLYGNVYTNTMEEYFN